MSDYTMGCLAVAGVGLVIAVGAIDVYASTSYSDRWRTCTVESKDRGASSDGSSHYRIYTRDCGVFGDGDSWLRGKTNSADIYGRIQPGHTYHFHVVGYRLGLTSHFPNILAAEEVSSR